MSVDECILSPMQTGPLQGRPPAAGTAAAQDRCRPRQARPVPWCIALPEETVQERHRGTIYNTESMLG
jgi:hypothetical protein